MGKIMVLLDNGHGINTPGKRSPDAAKNITGSAFYLREYAWTREVAKICESMLKMRGYDCEILVPEEHDVPLATRASRVNAWCKKMGKDKVILVSIHNNAAGDGSRWMSARGWAAYTTKGVTKADYLAECLYSAAASVFHYPQKIRKYKDKYLERDWEENFYILTKTSCPAVLVENFFQDNRDDVKYLNSENGKIECARVIVDGIDKYAKTYK